MKTRAEAEKAEEDHLACYAQKSGRSRGRRHHEDQHAYRTDFMRDRDRIIHSSAFRRLEYKTQVFVYHEGDHYRTRLTHTMEVAQIARTIARALGLNEDLCEAIALSHDLGHPPFGHSGQHTLNRLMGDNGQFEHNAHSLRIVDHIEHAYTGFRGLNLTWEVREAIAKHSKNSGADEVVEFSKLPQASMEAQVADIADSIAYNSHDLDDGITSGLMTIASMDEVALWRRFYSPASESSTPKLAKSLAIRKIINAQVGDVIDETEKAVTAYQISDPDKARANLLPVVRFSDSMKKDQAELKRFLHKNMYTSYKVILMEEKVCKVIEDLFATYERRPQLLPPHVYAKTGSEGKYRMICDYIAGMTDRYAFEEHRRLFDPSTRV